MPEGKTVTIQHLSSEQASQGGTTPDTPLPETSGGGGGIGAWISQNRVMLLIIGGGAILGLFIYFYVKNQQQSTVETATTDTGASTDSTTTTPDGTSSGMTPDLSPVESLLNQLQQSSDITNQDLSALLSQQQSSTNTTNVSAIPKPGVGVPGYAGKKCPSGMHHRGGDPNGNCVCNGKNMVNKGDHCEPKAKHGGAEDVQFAIGGSDMYNDMFQVRQPWRSNGHRMVYALGGGVMTPTPSSNGYRPTVRISRNVDRHSSWG